MMDNKIVFAALFSMSSAAFSHAGSLNQCALSANRPLIATASLASPGKTATLAPPSLSVLTNTSGYLYVSPTTYNAAISNLSPVLANLSQSVQSAWGTFAIGLHLTCPEQPELARTCTTLPPYAGVGCFYPDFNLDSASLQPGALTVTVADSLGQDVPLNSNSLPTKSLVLKQFSNTRNSATGSDAILRLMAHGNRLTFTGTNSLGHNKLFAIDTAENISQVSNFNPNWSDYLDQPAYSSSFGLLSLGSPDTGITRRLLAYTGTQWKQLSTAAFTTFRPIGDYQGSFYFVGKNSSGYLKMFRYNGSAMTQIADLAGGWSDDFTSNVSPGIVYNNQLYFVAYNNWGVEKLYRYDGTKFQVAMNLNASSKRDTSGANPTPVIFGNKLFFIAYNSSNLPVLVSYDGASAKIIQGIQPAVSTFGLAVHGSALYLVGSTPRWKLFRYDGTTLAQVSNVNGTGADDVTQFAPVSYGGWLYYWGANALGKNKLYALDGSQILQITDLNGANADDIPAYYAGLSVFNNKLFVSMSTSSRLLKNPRLRLDFSDRLQIFV